MNYSWGTGDCQAWAGAVEPTSYKVLLAGYNMTSGKADFALMRTMSDGSLDTSFDTDGKALTSFGANTTNGDQIFQLALQSDGKIVAAGNTGTGASGGVNDIAVARYNSDGSLDTSFDTDGKFTTQFGTTSMNVRDAVIETNTGKIVLGVETSSGNYDNGVVRIWGN